MWRGITKWGANKCTPLANNSRNGSTQSRGLCMFRPNASSFKDLSTRDVSSHYKFVPLQVPTMEVSYNIYKMKVLLDEIVIRQRSGFRRTSWIRMTDVTFNWRLLNVMLPWQLVENHFFDRTSCRIRPLADTMFGRIWRLDDYVSIFRRIYVDFIGNFMPFLKECRTYVSPRLRSFAPYKDWYERTKHPPPPHTPIIYTKVYICLSDKCQIDLKSKGSRGETEKILKLLKTVCKQANCVFLSGNDNF